MAATGMSRLPTPTASKAGFGRPKNPWRTFVDDRLDPTEPGAPPAIAARQSSEVTFV